jgi:hypothetical protein
MHIQSKDIHAQHLVQTSVRERVQI